MDVMWLLDYVAYLAFAPAVIVLGRSIYRAVKGDRGRDGQRRRYGSSKSDGGAASCSTHACSSGSCSSGSCGSACGGGD